MTKLINILLSLFLISLVACKEEFWPEIDKYENLLVVDGFVSDQPGPYTVRLSISTGVQNPVFTPYPGAQVLISDDQGNSEMLTEVEEGIYVTETGGIKGTVGRQYKVSINTPDERSYESGYQTLTASVGIDTVYNAFESQSTEDPEKMLYGYQFYVNTMEASSDSVYLLWRVNGTYEYQSDFKIRFYYDYGLFVFPDSDSLYTCWNDDQTNQIYTMSTIGLSTPIIEDLPLNYVDTETRKLSVRYSLLVKQMSLSLDAYSFYSRLKEMNDGQDLLYSQQPYQVRGNVLNIENSDEPVLGYFLVAGTTEKRIFVDPPSPKYFNYGVCVLGDRDLEAYGYIRWTDHRSWPLYVTTNLDGQRALPQQGCVDCRQKGGSIDKPDFWED